MGFEDAPPIPLLQGIGSSAYELAELLWGVCMFHAYILLLFTTKDNTVYALLLVSSRSLYHLLTNSLTGPSEWYVLSQ